VPFEDRRSGQSRVFDKNLKADFSGDPLPLSHVLTVWLAEQLQASGTFSRVEVVGPAIRSSEIRFKGGQGEPQPGQVVGAQPMSRAYSQTKDDVLVASGEAPRGDIVVTGALESLDAESYWENVMTGQRRVAAGFLLEVKATASLTGRVLMERRYSVQHDAHLSPDQSASGSQVTVRPGETHQEFVGDLQKVAADPQMTRQKMETVAEDLSRALPWMAHAVNRVIMDEMQRDVVAVLVPGGSPSRVGEGSSPVGVPPVGAVSMSALDQRLTSLSQELESVSPNRQAQMRGRQDDGGAVREDVARRLMTRKAELEKMFREEIADGSMKIEQKGERLLIRVAGDALFALGDTKVSPAGQKLLKQVGVALKRDPEKKVTVEAHTSNQPLPGMSKSTQGLVRLSQARADNVAHYLAKQGAAPNSKVQAVGMGPKRPVATNKTSEGRTKNRRVDIVVTPR
jgi:flagellar motor protein MotB